MDDNTVKKLALIITANCLRDTPVETKTGPRAFSEADLNILRKSMSDRLYTFLLYLLNNKPASEYSALMEELARNYPADWPMPELDSKLTQSAVNANAGAVNGIRL